MAVSGVRAQYDAAGNRLHRTDLERRQTVADRHAELRELGKCINGPRVGDVGNRGVVHGPVVGAGRCQRCLDVKRRTH